jgi:ABC-type oligopeptide transport system substrate-binding subunit
LRERSSGKAFSFEILVTTRDQERLAIAFQRDLKRAGIDARVRVVDAVQYDRRCINYDFEMIHEPNLSSGGQVADIEIGAFLIGAGSGPEKQELLRLISTLV